MNNYVIIHDKLLEFGGAEVVLRSLIRYRKPSVVICSCVDDRNKWENLLGVKVLSPVATAFIKNQKQYKIFYPYIIFVVFLSRAVLKYQGAFFIVYSSSAGKYFRLPKKSKSILYVNYHAKGVRNFKKYLPHNWLSKILEPFFLVGSLLLSACEDKILTRFQYIRAISNDSLNSLPEEVVMREGFDIAVLHCPAPRIEAVTNYKFRFRNCFSKYYVIVSRLYPEKGIEPLLRFIFDNTNLNIVIIGDGDEKMELERKYSSRFEFVGFVESCVRNSILLSCEAVIQPTVQEWSLVTIEANMLGIPVVAARSGGLEEINYTISGERNSPNLLYSTFNEMLECIQHTDRSMFFLKQNINKTRWLFSEELFHMRIFELENKMNLM